MKMPASFWKFFPLGLFLLAAGIVTLDMVPEKMQNVPESKRIFEVSIKWNFEGTIHKRGIVPVKPE